MSCMELKVYPVVGVINRLIGGIREAESSGQGAVSVIGSCARCALCRAPYPWFGSICWLVRWAVVHSFRSN